MIDYIRMYKALPSGSRELVRSKRYEDKAMQSYMRRSWIEFEYYEMLAQDHECDLIRCSHE